MGLLYSEITEQVIGAFFEIYRGLGTAFRSWCTLTLSQSSLACEGSK